MGYQTYTLTAEKRTVDIALREDRKYLNLLGLYSNTESLEDIKLNGFSLLFTAQKNGKSIEETVHLTQSKIVKRHGIPYILLNHEFNADELQHYDKFTVELRGQKNIGGDLELECDLTKIFLPVNPFDDFESHLQDTYNQKIVFSAPFGHGKTTFLKLFFKPQKANYEVFYLYPVNYSVASNEDVFRYIKTELLFQLLGRDVVFKEGGLPIAKTLKGFLGANAHNVLAPFIKLLPLVGGNAYDIYEKLNDLKEKYFDYHDQQNVDEKGKAESYIKEIYEKEGSIYEDNFYTLLIRELVNQLKNKGRKTILVIDDIDRIDPEHIFRILNVFSAHIDSIGNNDSVSTNKFDLDKIILVCDYSNIENIFTHRYGAKADFRGYFDKFFSKGVYHYDNQHALNYFIDEITLGRGNNEHIAAEVMSIVLKMFAATQNISLRELIQLKDHAGKKLFEYHGEKTILKTVVILSGLFKREEVLTKLERTIIDYNEIPRGNRAVYGYYILHMIMAITDGSNVEGGKEFKFQLGDDKIAFKAQGRMRTYEASDDFMFNGEVTNIHKKEFSAKEFLSVFMDIVNYYYNNKASVNANLFG